MADKKQKTGMKPQVGNVEATTKLSDKSLLSEFKKADKPKSDLLEEVITVRRVTKVVKGGRRLGFSAFVVVGDGAGKVGVGSGKGREVAPAVSKALRAAKKAMITVPLYKSTLPFDIYAKFGAGKVLIRSASLGTGVIAGGPVRAIMSALGVRDVLAKSTGSGNPITVAHAVMKALTKLKSAAQIAKMRA